MMSRFECFIPNELSGIGERATVLKFERPCHDESRKLNEVFIGYFALLHYYCYCYGCHNH